jgi:hypothetical protein
MTRQFIFAATAWLASLAAAAGQTLGPAGDDVASDFAATPDIQFASTAAGGALADAQVENTLAGSNEPHRERQRNA